MPTFAQLRAILVLLSGAIQVAKTILVTQVNPTVWLFMVRVFIVLST